MCLRKFLRDVMSAVAVLAITVLAVSCASTRTDEFVSAENDASEDAIASVEKLVVEMDGGILNGAVPSQREFQKAHEACDRFISDSSIQSMQLARAYALKGRICLMEGKKSRARQYLSDSQKMFAGEAHAVVLASRLGEAVSLDEESQKLSSASERALLSLEKAISLYSQKNYLNALALFDASFISLPPFYRDAYRPLREHSWSLRNSGGSDMLSKSEMTVAEMLVITQDSSSVLNAYTGGRKLSSSELYRKLAAAKMLSAAGNPSDVLLQEAVVSRVSCARFMWNLYASARNLNPLMYSEMFADYGSSPFPDVDLTSSDFDAVLGCVENEIINLEDGVHFMGAAPVAPADYSEWLKKTF